MLDFTPKLLARTPVDVLEPANYIEPRRSVFAVGALPGLEL